jgi:hypothetical protein
MYVSIHTAMLCHGRGSKLARSGTLRVFAQAFVEFAGQYLRQYGFGLVRCWMGASSLVIDVRSLDMREINEMLRIAR